MLNEVPGFLSDGLRINVLPHVTAIGNICDKITKQIVRFHITILSPMQEKSLIPTKTHYFSCLENRISVLKGPLGIPIAESLRES